MLQFELPFPPSVNHYWRVGRGRMWISDEGRAFRETVCSILAASGTRPLTGRLAVHVEISPPDRRRRDLDNTAKALLDALQQGGAYQDDSQIVSLHIEKGTPVKGGKTFVRIRKL